MTNKSEALTAEMLRSALIYKPDEGIFYWKKSPANSVPAGTAAGSVDARGYMIIKLNGVRYYAHRLVCLYQTGSWPKNKLWHKRGSDKTNNKWIYISKLLNKTDKSE